MMRFAAPRHPRPSLRCTGPRRRATGASRARCYPRRSARVRPCSPDFLEIGARREVAGQRSMYLTRTRIWRVPALTSAGCWPLSGGRRDLCAYAARNDSPGVRKKVPENRISLVADNAAARGASPPMTDPSDCAARCPQSGMPLPGRSCSLSSSFLSPGRRQPQVVSCSAAARCPEGGGSLRIRYLGAPSCRPLGRSRTA